MLEPRLDPVQEVPARCAVSNMIAGRAALVVSRVELTNEGFGSLVARVVDTELDGLDANSVLSE